MRHLAGALLGIALLVPTVAFAAPTPITSMQSALPAGLSYCPAVYPAGALVFHWNSNPTLSPGKRFELVGNLENRSSSAVVDATVFAKVISYANDAHEAPALVVRVPIATHVTIRPGRVRSISFAWTVPATIPPGHYGIVAAVAAGNRFSIAGSAGVDAAGVGAFDFTIPGASVGRVTFNLAKISVGPRILTATGTPAVAPSYSISIPLSNTGKSAVRGTVSWKLYTGLLGLDDTTIVQRATSEVSIPAGGTAAASIKITDPANLHYLVGTFSSQDGSVPSSVGVPLDAVGVAEPVLTLVGVNSSIGIEKRGAYACVVSLGASDPAVRIELSVTRASAVVASASYRGPIPQMMLGVGSPPYAVTATFWGSSAPVVLDAKIFHGDTLIDEAVVPYDCDALAGDCSAGLFSFEGTSSLMLEALLAIIVLAGLGLWVHRTHFGQLPASQPPANPPFV